MVEGEIWEMDELRDLIAAEGDARCTDVTATEGLSALKTYLAPSTGFDIQATLDLAERAGRRASAAEQSALERAALRAQAAGCPVQDVQLTLTRAGWSDRMKIYVRLEGRPPIEAMELMRLWRALDVPGSVCAALAGDATGRTLEHVAVILEGGHPVAAETYHAMPEGGLLDCTSIERSLGDPAHAIFSRYARWRTPPSAGALSRLLGSSLDEARRLYGIMGVEAPAAVSVVKAEGASRSRGVSLCRAGWSDF